VGVAAVVVNAVSDARGDALGPCRRQPAISNLKGLAGHTAPTRGVVVALPSRRAGRARPCQ